jgi:hypothetical protein
MSSKIASLLAASMCATPTGCYDLEFRSKSAPAPSVQQTRKSQIKRKRKAGKK